MLICPECQFENPDTHNFCQSCGASLSHKSCPDCGTNVPFDAQNCSNCGAFTGTVWWALVVGDPSTSNQLDEAIALLDRRPSTEESAPVAPLGEDSLVKYLDARHRYELLEPLKPLKTATAEFEAMVLDRRPLQISMLSALQHQAAGDDVAEIPEMSRFSSLAIPKIAQLYLELQSQLYHTLPDPHDSWESDKTTVLLLEDRSDWQLLLDCWSDETLPLEQILFVLDEMVRLWEFLEPVGCRQSLLLPDNLLVDEDQIFCLKRLHLDPECSALTLKDLGRLWQTLFEQTQLLQSSAIVSLLQDIHTGAIGTAEQLRSQLRAIADQLETNATAMVPPEEQLNSTNSESDKFDAERSQEVVADLSSRDVPESASNPSAPTHFQTSDSPERTEGMDDLPTVVLPMQLFSLEDAGLTDTGRQRERNEDAFCIQTKIERLENRVGRTIHARGLYILCDGMGGHAGGEVASSLAVDTLKNYFQTHWLEIPEMRDRLPARDIILQSVKLANQAIYEVNQQQGRTGNGRMGTTLVLVLIQDTNIAVAHVGDSRLYKFTRKQGLEAVTQDHDVGQREIQRGVEPEIAYSRLDAYQLTQALGPRNEDFIKPDLQFLEINEDTLLLLSSDGLTDNDLVEKHCHTHLEPLIGSRANLERGVNDLIDLANQHNGHDNITAVAIRAKVRPNLGNFRD